MIDVDSWQKLDGQNWESILYQFVHCMHGLNREDAMDRARWRKLIGMIDDYDESSG